MLHARPKLTKPRDFESNFVGDDTIFRIITQNLPPNKAHPQVTNFFPSFPNFFPQKVKGAP